MDGSTARIVIKAGREKPIRNQHPWVFSGAIAAVEGDPQPGGIVTVLDSKGIFLARGYYNPKSQIQVRLLTWQDEPIDTAWWQRMLQRAITMRSSCQQQAAGTAAAYRLVNAENDFLPGLVVDRYSDWLVLQALTLGIDQRKTILTEILTDLLRPQGIYERSDVDVREREGLGMITGVLYGAAPPQPLVIVEHGLNIQMDVQTGHKTGFYLDQQENRAHLAQLVAQIDSTNPIRVLNVFSYTGGFGLFARKAGAAQVVNVDSSAAALETAEANFALNGLSSDKIEFYQADSFQLLRDFAASHAHYDVVILDPPKFAQNAQQVEKAARGYKDINLSAIRIVKPGGYLMTFSCSGAITADLFQKIVFGALADTGRQAQILRHLGPGIDHPVALTFPEGAYLKGLLLRVY